MFLMALDYLKGYIMENSRILIVEDEVIIAKDIILNSNLSEETILKYLPWNKNIISDLEKDLETDWMHKIVEGFSSHKDKLF